MARIPRKLNGFKAFLFILLWGVLCYGWYYFVWVPSDAEKSKNKKVAEERPPSIHEKPPQSSQTEPFDDDEQASEQEDKEAKKAVEQFIQIYLTNPRQGAQDLADQLKEFCHEDYLFILRNSQRVPEHVKIKGMKSAPIIPSYIDGGITYRIVVTLENDEEVDYVFSLTKDYDGKWKVLREEPDVGYD